VLVSTILPPDDSQFEGLKYACSIRYIAPKGNGARSKWCYNILDSEWKDFAELLCNYLHKKTQWTGFYFLKATSGLWAHQGGDGDHVTIYNWQGQRLAINIGKRPLLRWQQAEIPVW